MGFLAYIKNGKKVKNNFMPAKYPASRVSYDDDGTETNLQTKVSELNADMKWKKISSNTQYIQIPDGAVELFVIVKNSTSSSFKLVGNVLVQAVLDYAVGGIPLWSISADFRIEYSSANGITATQYTNGTVYNADAMVLYYR